MFYYYIFYIKIILNNKYYILLYYILIKFPNNLRSTFTCILPAHWEATSIDPIFYYDKILWFKFLGQFVHILFNILILKDNY